jgi:hypothetical protein
MQPNNVCNHVRSDHLINRRNDIDQQRAMIRRRGRQQSAGLSAFTGAAQGLLAALIELHPANRLCNVAFGSLTDICTATEHVRFTPESEHQRTKLKCPLKGQKQT